MDQDIRERGEGMKADKVGQLYTKFGKQLHALAWQTTHDTQVAQDAVQMVFEKILNNPEPIDDSLDPMVYGLLRRMTLNAISDIYTKERKTVPLPDIQKEILTADEQCTDDPLSKLLQKEFLQDMKNAINSLPDTYRVPLMLRVAHNLTNQQIAKVLDIEVGNVYIRIHRARSELRKMLQKEGKL